MDREATRHRGAAFNAMMEGETKESLAEMCCKLMDEIAELKKAARPVQVREYTSESMVFSEVQ